MHLAKKRVNSKKRKNSKKGKIASKTTKCKQNSKGIEKYLIQFVIKVIFHKPISDLSSWLWDVIMNLFLN